VVIGILGAGAWGTALGVALARHGPERRVLLWGRGQGRAAEMTAARENRQYLPGIAFPPNLVAVDDAAEAIRADLVILAPAVAGLRDAFTACARAGVKSPVIWLSKGFEPGRALLPHQIAAQLLPGGVPRGALSGPSFAAEVARGLPAALTLASTDAAFAADAARRLHGGALRVYSSGDLVGVEVGGAVKNVIALAAGISDGLGLGLNARAALITRGLAEMTRLGAALGARAETFMGLTGMGDLILTATGDLSRNRTVGLRLAAGESLEGILERLGHVAEGVGSARESRTLARRLGVEMPITEGVCAILDGQIDARTAVSALLARDPRPE
jgi:glycerol-3-phosphate dehydrogenase (NAD(P)+)